MAPPQPPAPGASRSFVSASDRLLSPDELARLGVALDTAEGRENPFAIAAIRMLILTGSRHNEIRKLTWPEVDLGAAAVLRLVDSKTGPKIVHLPPAARSLLNALPRVAGSPLVFPGAGGPVNLARAWHRIREGAGLHDVRLHDLRHAFASIAAAAGVPLVVVGKLLGHRAEAMTMRYAPLDRQHHRQRGRRHRPAARGRAHLAPQVKSCVERNNRHRFAVAQHLRIVKKGG
jgi:integrase